MGALRLAGLARRLVPVTVPYAWAAAWFIIDAVAAALTDAGLDVPIRREVGSGGVDYAGVDCCPAILVDLVPESPDANLPGCSPAGALRWRADLYVLRACLPRGVDPSNAGRLADPGEAPDPLDPCDWVPDPDSWHGGQIGLLADLEAIWDKASVVNFLPCSSSFDCSMAVAGRVVAFRTGTQGRCQGWRIPYTFAYGR